MVPTAGLLVHYNDTEVSYLLMKSESTGGENLRIIKIYAKAFCVVILFLTLYKVIFFFFFKIENDNMIW